MIGSLLVAIWLILVGVDWLGWITISIKLLGLIAFIAGLVWLIESTKGYWSRPNV